MEGGAKLTCLITGRSWDGEHTHALDFVDDHKVTDYQVRADFYTAAAYIASSGQLGER
jgi:hypothetical protein